MIRGESDIRLILEGICRFRLMMDPKQGAGNAKPLEPPQRHQLAHDLHGKLCFHILDHLLLLNLSG